MIVQRGFCLIVYQTFSRMKSTVETNVAAPVADTWRALNAPDDIVQWDASEEWHTPWASNDLTVGGKLLLRLEANDGGAGVDFAATYTQIERYRVIESRDDEGRLEWQTVLDRFARYVERQCGATQHPTRAEPLAAQAEAEE